MRQIKLQQGKRCATTEVRQRKDVQQQKFDKKKCKLQKIVEKNYKQKLSDTTKNVPRKNCKTKLKGKKITQEFLLTRNIWSQSTNYEHSFKISAPYLLRFVIYDNLKIWRKIY